MELKLLHTADIHLDAPFPSLGNKEAARRKDLLDCFERLVNLAIKNEVHLFVVAGDLFDSPRPSAQVVGKVQAGLQRLADRGIVSVLLPGTHDHLVAPDSVYRKTLFPGTILLDSARIESPQVVNISGVDVFIYGFAYHPRFSEGAMSGFRKRAEEGIHIGVLHGSLKGSPEWDHRGKDLPFSLEDVKSWGLDYLALGHYHNFALYKPVQGAVACYSGSPEGRRFGENGPRYCALVTMGTEGAVVKKLQINQRSLIEETIDVSGVTTEETLVSNIRRFADSNVILRVTLAGVVEVPFELDRLYHRCEEEFFFLEIQDKTDLFDSSLVKDIQNEETIRGLFVRRIGSLIEKVDPEEHQILEEALREVLARFSREHKG